MKKVMSMLINEWEKWMKKKYNGNMSSGNFYKGYEHMNEWMKNVGEKITMGTLLLNIPDSLDRRDVTLLRRVECMSSTESMMWLHYSSREDRFYRYYILIKKNMN
jgi:hypothetical protein